MHSYKYFCGWLQTGIGDILMLFPIGFQCCYCGLSPDDQIHRELLVLCNSLVEVLDRQTAWAWAKLFGLLMV